METGGRRGRGAVVQEQVTKQEEGKKEKRSKRIKDKKEEDLEVRKEKE